MHTSHIHKSSLASYTRSAIKGHSVASQNRRTALLSLEEAEQHLAVAARLAVDPKESVRSPSSKPPVPSTQFLGGSLAVETSTPSVSVILRPPSPESLVQTLAAVPLKPRVLLAHEQHDAPGQNRSRNADKQRLLQTEALSESGVVLTPPPAAVCPPKPQQPHFASSLSAPALSAPLLGAHATQPLTGIAPGLPRTTTLSEGLSPPSRASSLSPARTHNTATSRSSSTSRAPTSSVQAEGDAALSRQLSQSLSSASSALLLTSRRVGGGGRSITTIPSLGQPHTPTHRTRTSAASRTTPAPLARSGLVAGPGALANETLSRFTPRVYRLGGPTSRKHVPAQLPTLAGGSASASTTSSNSSFVGAGVGMLRREVGVQVTLLRPDMVLPEQEELLRQRIHAERQQNRCDASTDPPSRPSTPDTSQPASAPPTASMAAMLQQLRQLASSEESLRHRLKATTRHQEAQTHAWRTREQQLEEERLRLRKEVLVLKAQLLQRPGKGTRQPSPAPSSVAEAADERVETPHVMQVDVSARALSAAEALERAVAQLRARASVEGQCICPDAKRRVAEPVASVAEAVVRVRARSVPSQRRVHAQLAYEQHRRFLAHCWCVTDAGGCCVHTAQECERQQARGALPRTTTMRRSSVLASGEVLAVPVAEAVHAIEDAEEASCTLSEDEGMDVSLDMPDSEDSEATEEDSGALGEWASAQPTQLEPFPDEEEEEESAVARPTHILSPRRPRNVRAAADDGGEGGFLIQYGTRVTPATPHRRERGRAGAAGEPQPRREGTAPRGKLAPMQGGNGIGGVAKVVKVPRTKAKASLMDAHNGAQSGAGAGTGSKAKKSREERSLELITAAMAQLQDRGLNLHQATSPPKKKSTTQKSRSRAESRTESRSSRRAASEASDASGRESVSDVDVPSTHSRLSTSWQQKQAHREELDREDRDSLSLRQADRLERRERAQQERTREREERQRAREAKVQEMHAARERERQRIREMILRSAGLTPVEAGQGVQLGIGTEDMGVILGRDGAGQVVQHALTAAQAQLLAQAEVEAAGEDSDGEMAGESLGELPEEDSDGEERGSARDLPVPRSATAKAVGAEALRDSYRATTFIPDVALHPHAHADAHAQAAMSAAGIVLAPALAEALRAAGADAGEIALAGQAYADRVQSQLHALQAVHLAQMQARAQAGATQAPADGDVAADLAQAAVAALAPLGDDSALSTAFAALLQQHYIPAHAHPPLPAAASMPTPASALSAALDTGSAVDSVVATTTPQNSIASLVPAAMASLAAYVHEHGVPGARVGEDGSLSPRSLALTHAHMLSRASTMHQTQEPLPVLTASTLANPFAVLQAQLPPAHSYPFLPAHLASRLSALSLPPATFASSSSRLNAEDTIHNHPLHLLLNPLGDDRGPAQPRAQQDKPRSTAAVPNAHRDVESPHSSPAATPAAVDASFDALPSLNAGLVRPVAASASTTASTKTTPILTATAVTAAGGSSSLDTLQLNTGDDGRHSATLSPTQGWAAGFVDSGSVWHALDLNHGRISGEIASADASPTGDHFDVSHPLPRAASVPTDDIPHESRHSLHPPPAQTLADLAADDVDITASPALSAQAPYHQPFRQDSLESAFMRSSLSRSILRPSSTYNNAHPTHAPLSGGMTASTSTPALLQPVQPHFHRAASPLPPVSAAPLPLALSASASTLPHVSTTDHAPE